MVYGVVILVHIINKEKAHYNNIKRASTLCAGPLENKSLKHTHDTILIQSYGFCTPVTQRQVLIKINFQAPKTIQTNYWQPPDCGLIIR